MEILFPLQYLLFYSIKKKLKQFTHFSEKKIVPQIKTSNHKQDHLLINTHL